MFFAGILRKITLIMIFLKKQVNQINWTLYLFWFLQQLSNMGNLKFNLNAKELSIKGNQFYVDANHESLITKK
jgi:hypothetical protein